MIIEANKVVTVDYELTAKEGSSPESLIEKTDKENPFVFIFGSGHLLEAFEANLKGKKVGDTFDFHIQYMHGYGPKEIGHIVDIPIESFQQEDGSVDHEMLKVGSMIPMTDHEGNRLQGLIKEKSLSAIKMDFNHPLAGQDLHFVGKVLDIRNATAEELAHGHVHGPGGHHH